LLIFIYKSKYLLKLLSLNTTIFYTYDRMKIFITIILSVVFTVIILVCYSKAKKYVEFVKRGCRWDIRIYRGRK